MSVFFSASEVLQVAVEIEKNGIVFYNTLAQGTAENVLRDTYGFLSEQEKEHQATFQVMLDSLPSYYSEESYPGEQAVYVSALADDILFSSRSAIHTKASLVNDDLQALELAIGLEKDSILFYTGMQVLVRQPDRAALRAVIDEEKTHFLRLRQLKEKHSKA